MSCVCLGNPVQISTCPIRLLHTSENSANFSSACAHDVLGTKKLYMIWEQLRLSQHTNRETFQIYEPLSLLHLWLIIRSLTQKRSTNATNSLDKHENQIICQPVKQVNMAIALCLAFSFFVCICIFQSILCNTISTQILHV